MKRKGKKQYWLALDAQVDQDAEAAASDIVAEVTA